MGKIEKKKAVFGKAKKRKVSRIENAGDEKGCRGGRELSD